MITLKPMHLCTSGLFCSTRKMAGRTLLHENASISVYSETNSIIQKAMERELDFDVYFLIMSEIPILRFCKMLYDYGGWLSQGCGKISENRVVALSCLV